MNKAKRIVSLLLLISILLGTFSSVFAADIYGQSEQISNSEKVKRLVERGYVVGYSDDSLGLDRNITRAEFTAIITRALGLEDVALASGNIPTGYTDVNVSAWYNPYVAVASSKGIIKGYPDGTFKPEIGVKYQEAITMLVRMVSSPQEIAIIEATGTYPMNYYTKASQLGLLEGLYLGDINIPAERGNVFVMLYNAIRLLEEKNSVNTDILVLEKNDSTIKAAVLKNSGNFKEHDIVNLKLNTISGEEINVGKVYNVRITLDNQLISFNESDNATVISAKATKNKNDIKINNKKYDSDGLIVIKYNNEETNFKSLPKEVNYAKAIIYLDKLIYLEGFNFDEILPVENIKNNRIYGITDDGSVKYINVSKNTEIYLFKDGNMTELELDDVDKGDIIHIQKERKNTKIIVTKEKVEGEVNNYNDKKQVLTIDNKEYNVAIGDNPAILAQDKKYFALKNFSMLEMLKDYKVKASLNISGDIQFIETDKDISIYVKAIVEEKDRDRITALTEYDYKDYFYVTDYTELITSSRNDRYNRYNRYDRYNIERIMSQIEEGDIVKLLVDGRGDIEEIEILDGEEATISYMDDYVAEINKRDYDLADDIVIFENFNGKYYVVDLYDLVDAFYEDRDLELNAIVFMDGREIEAMIIETIDMDSKKELINLVNTAKTSIEVAEKYNQNGNVAKAILDLNKAVEEVEKNIDRFTNKEIEVNKEKIKALTEALNREVLAEILIQIEKKLESVKNGEELYNEEAYEEIEKYVAETKTNKEIEDYFLKVKEAEKVLNEFDEKMFSNIDEFKKEKNLLEQLLLEEREDIEKVLNRAIYNEEAVNKYDFFITGLMNELENIQDIETLRVWKEELENRRNEYLRDRFDLRGKNENEIRVYKLEEMLDVANALLEGSKGNTSTERSALESKVRSVNTFIAKVKKSTSDEIDINELSSLEESLAKAIVDMAAKMNISLENAPLRLRNRIAEAEEVKQLLLQNGKIDDVFELNNIIFSIKAKVYAGKTSESEIEEMILQVESFLANIDIEEEQINMQMEEVINEELEEVVEFQEDTIEDTGEVEAEGNNMPESFEE